MKIQNTIKLYNVTFKTDDYTNTLIPKIPETAADCENKDIPRVCLSDNIEGCFQAIASERRNICKGARFILREADVPLDENLILPSTLKEKDYVFDALENNEYWCLKPIQCKSKLCEIVSFDYDFTIAWTCITKEQCEEIVHKYAPELNTKDCVSPKEVYDKFCIWATDTKSWTEFDEVWEELVELPYAQLTQISNIEYRVLKELSKKENSDNLKSKELDLFDGQEVLI